MSGNRDSFKTTRIIDMLFIKLLLFTIFLGAPLFRISDALWDKFVRGMFRGMI